MLNSVKYLHYEKTNYNDFPFINPANQLVFVREKREGAAAEEGMQQEGTLNRKEVYVLK